MHRLIRTFAAFCSMSYCKWICPSRNFKVTELQYFKEACFSQLSIILKQALWAAVCTAV